MGSLCFSSASILRCESFTGLQSQLLIIPTALELVFSTALIFTNWGTGWRHLLLTAEGWSYFALALLELLSHNLPAVRDSVTVFSIVDIVLGATSFIPILFYTLFVYLFTRGELIDTLPQRFQRIANVLLLFFIPAIIALNELSSFIGIHRRILTSNGRPVLAIGFESFNDQQIWTFFTSLTLALLTAFEAINFCFAFYRLIRAFVDQRRIETTSSDSAHLIRGIGWISGGFKLGAIETVIGFAQGGFGGALTRRVVRFLARAFLIVGIAKGVDFIDDFTEMTKEMDAAARSRRRPTNAGNAFRRSKLGMMISNPRFSTFRQLSPTAKEFYQEKANGGAESAMSPVAGPSGSGGPRMSEFTEARRAALLATPPSPLYTLSGPTMQQRQGSPLVTKPTGLQRSQTAGSTFTTYSAGGTATRQQRVTVHFPEGSSGAPTLQMRFSGLEMPSPAVIAESVKARPVSATWMSMARSSRYAPSIAPSFAFDPVPPMTEREPVPPVPTASTTPMPAYPEFIYERNAVPESTLGDTASASSYYPNNGKGKGKATQHTRGASEFSTRSENLSAVRELAGEFPVPGIPLTQLPRARQAPPTPIPESPYPQQQQRDRRSWDPERGFGNTGYDAYGQPQRDDPPPMQYTYGGMEYPTTPTEPEEEPVYRYAYDGPVSSPERIPHPYANAAAYAPAQAVPYSPPRINDAYSPHSDNAYSPPTNVYSPPTRQNQDTRHRNKRSDTTLGTTPQTYASSRFDRDDGESRATTPNTESGTGSDPFQFDAMSGKTRSQQQYQQRYQQQLQYDGEEEYTFPQENQGVPEEVFIDDGPHSHQRQHVQNMSIATRTSAALLQMTQREEVDWTPAGVEFTPSVFSASRASTPTGRNTLKKKRRPSVKGDQSLPASVDTLASSWLHGPPDDLDADDEGVSGIPVGVGAGGPARVKSVGRVRAPRKATPAPVSTKHGLTRGSVYIQPITVPPAMYNTEVQIVQGGSSADSYNSEFVVEGL
ncbi:hypothetical protein MSAN_00887600 [Mycena sanguinolenta]|uniref:Uncharacterized protein n=1 Tax=Mycena sanguinolenta TaxID=230812 RepID=A0A8H6YW60_9AGAR|nr:hypothetical protein MSAN_00887600 [Mycena sanguinolenta]